LNFDLEKLFIDVFAPDEGEVITIMHDIPNEYCPDSDEWRARRKMAKRWYETIEAFSDNYGFKINPIVTYHATGSHNADLPETAMFNGEFQPIKKIIDFSTIIISMPEYSASAPLILFTNNNRKLRVASMPMVTPQMEITGLAADYKKIAEKCKRLSNYFIEAVAIEVEFSTGHHCLFDINGIRNCFKDDAYLHPRMNSDKTRLSNLPAGEVCVCPDIVTNSKTRGEIPVMLNDEIIVYSIEENRITDVSGKSDAADSQSIRFQSEPALRNIAEVAIGCNEKAIVTGNVLEDEKAGFHWAFGRSDHIGGRVGVNDFSAKENVVHQDIVYAKGNEIECRLLNFIYPDGTRLTLIVDGELILQELNYD